MTSEYWQAVEAISNCIVAFGVVVALYQVRAAGRQQVTTFEDGFHKEYREIIRKIPVGVMLGEALDPRPFLQQLHSYFDLCNEPALLRKRRRVSDRAWAEWREGMKGNFGLPTFRQAWDQMHEKSPGEFKELMKLFESHFSEDPKYWKANL
jgi:hypothetical protein